MTTPCRRGRARAPFEELSRTESAALALAAAGLANAEIGTRLGVADAHVRELLRSARRATGMTTERALTAWYWRRLAQHVVDRAAERERWEVAS